MTVEQCQALTEIQNTANFYGSDVSFILNPETDLARDSYNSIKTVDVEPDFTFKCFPVIPNPTQRQLEKAGIYEKCDMIIYVPTKSLTDNGKSISDIDAIRTRIITYDDQEYTVKEKSGNGQIGDVYIYVTLGLEKI